MELPQDNLTAACGDKALALYVEAFAHILGYPRRVTTIKLAQAELKNNCPAGLRAFWDTIPVTTSTHAEYSCVTKDRYYVTLVRKKMTEWIESRRGEVGYTGGDDVYNCDYARERAILGRGYPGNLSAHDTQLFWILQKHSTPAKLSAMWAVPRPEVELVQKMIVSRASSKPTLSTGERKMQKRCLKILRPITMLRYPIATHTPGDVREENWPKPADLSAEERAALNHLVMDLIQRPETTSVTQQNKPTAPGNPGANPGFVSLPASGAAPESGNPLSGRPGTNFEVMEASFLEPSGSNTAPRLDPSAVAFLAEADVFSNAFYAGEPPTNYDLALVQAYHDCMKTLDDIPVYQVELPQFSMDTSK